MYKRNLHDVLCMGVLEMYMGVSELQMMVAELYTGVSKLYYVLSLNRMTASVSVTVSVLM